MKIMLMTVALMLPMTANAADLTVKVPAKACNEILSQEYSTGGGDTVIQYLEILCKSKDGKYTGHILSMQSLSGLIGWGRLAVPTTIEYVPYDGDIIVEAD